MKFLLTAPITACCLLACLLTGAQTPKMPEIPLIRKKFHDDIDASQRAIMKLDGSDDGKFTPSRDAEINMQATYALVNQVDEFQYQVESDTSFAVNDKIRYLRGFNDVLTSFISLVKARQLRPIVLPDVVHEYIDAVKLDRQGKSIGPVIARGSLDVGSITVRSFAFQNNPGLKNASDELFYKQLQRNPGKVLSLLAAQPDNPHADELIAAAAKRNQNEIYDRARASDALAEKIRASQDPLVKIIVRMAGMKSGRLLFPFLDDIYHNKMSVEDVDSSLDDPVRYYKLLVATEIDYADRVRHRDTPLAAKDLARQLELKGRETFVDVINGLHEQPDKERFRCLDPLSATELYYLAVMQEEEIYTSSYVRGVYPLIWQRMKVQDGDSLMMMVRFDRFKKWIKMAANYNMLGDFLKKMDKANAEALMKAFVSRLERTTTLEDAVDVANSYASISDPGLRRLVLDQVGINLNRVRNEGAIRGESIYSLLNTLFLSMDPANHINVSEALGIPPVYFTPNNSLKDTSGRIVVLQFFYGDKDGAMNFGDFMGAVRGAGWKIRDKDKWVEVSSSTGTPITIYSNKPFPEKKDEDGVAQAAMLDYMDDKGLDASVVIHRGHSYYLKATIDHLPASAKVVLLGSCGAYQSLSDVLNICPYAQIVSSKQTGSIRINQPLISRLLDALRRGEDLNWPKMWSQLATQFKTAETKDLFEDYVPPHKNLGAMFIMAYNKSHEPETE